MLDYLVVGAAFAGCVLAERLASQDGATVLLVERRGHIAGNAYDCYDDAGILVHKYGPYIFHCSSAEIFAYLSQFTAWRPYQHRVLASVDGQLLPIPINLETVNRLYGLSLTPLQPAELFESVAEPRDRLVSTEDAVVAKVGRDLHNLFFRGYTRKQWGVEPAALDAQVTARVPVRTNRDDRYFTDAYQAMPRHGYTRMFERMVSHPKIKLMLNTDWREIRDAISYRELIYTGPIDELFGYRFGRLPYRSLDFRFETLDGPFVQPVGTINYPNECDFTRITEFKHLTGQVHPKTTIVYEYPRADGDPYYPVPCADSAALYKRYRGLAQETSVSISSGGWRPTTWIRWWRRRSHCTSAYRTPAGWSSARRVATGRLPRPTASLATVRRPRTAPFLARRASPVDRSGPSADRRRRRSARPLQGCR